MNTVLSVFVTKISPGAAPLTLVNMHKTVHLAPGTPLRADPLWTGWLFRRSQL